VCLAILRKEDLTSSDPHSYSSASNSMAFALSETLFSSGMHEGSLRGSLAMSTFDMSRGANPIPQHPHQGSRAASLLSFGNSPQRVQQHRWKLMVVEHEYHSPACRSPLQARRPDASFRRSATSPYLSGWVRPHKTTFMPSAATSEVSNGVMLQGCYPKSTRWP